MGGHLHVPGPFTLKRTEQEVGWTPDPVWALGRRQISYFLSAMEARFLGRPARGLVAVPTRFPLHSFNDAASNSQYMVSKGTVITAVTL